MDSETKITNVRSLLITITLVVLIVTAGTFAWLNYRSKSTAMVLTIGDINDIQITLKPYQLDLELSPVLTYTSLDVNEEYVTVTVTNNSSSQQYYSLFYEISHIDSSLQSSDFKWTLLRTNDNDVTSGNFASANTTDPLYVLDEVTIPASTTYTYRVYTWVDGSNNPNIENAVFKGVLQAELHGSTKPLPKFIRNNAVIDNIASTYVTNSNGVQFNDISSDTNGKGIYIRSGTERDTYPIYYYRGAVDNNNVLFGGFCWKIVRTTDTGGIKLIYNGLPSGTNSNQCTNTTGTDTEIAKSVFNSNDTSIADVGYMYGTRYTRVSKVMTNISDTYMYGTSYDDTNHKLATTNAMNFAGSNWPTYYTQLNNNHYTCFNTSGECNQVNYIFYSFSDTAIYIQIPSGKTINGMLDEMLTGSSNANSSKVKTVIDTWYSNNLTSYTTYLEDTPFCNDCSIYSLSGWNPNGGSATEFLYFGAYNRTQEAYTPNITCTKGNAFTVNETSTGNGNLTYPISLLAADEIMLAGGGGKSNSTYYLYTNQEYWINSPMSYNNYPLIARVDSAGRIAIDYIFYSYGVRPSISLKNGLTYSGSGTSTDPYTVSY